MKIAFDHQIFSFQEYGGVSRYVCNLATNIVQQLNVEAKIFAPLHVNAYLENLPRNITSGHRLPNFTRVGNKYLSIVLNKALVIPQLRSFQPDIVHETYYSSVGYLPKGAQRVITVYDMTHEKFPAMFSPWRFTCKRKRDAVLRADHVICISHSTRKDLLELIDIPEKKVSVVHLGFDINKHHVSLAKNKGVNGGIPYILYVGSRDGYKNFFGALRAFSSSPLLRETFSFICFGGGAITKDELAMINRLNLPVGCVQFLRGGDDLLAELYANARLFIYPSLYEGFGLPPLEAMSYGCPVVCSDTSSIPEVVGNAAEYFNPNEISSIRMALEKVAFSDEKCAELISTGYCRISNFSWNKCADETLAIYRNLLS